MGQLIEVEGAVRPPWKQSQRRFYRPELDGLRFYAFLGVFLCHTLPLETTVYRNLHFPMPSLWASVSRSGAAGVDLFFVLSAFLITSLLLRERQETGEISLRLFYIRRILRIWPLYFLVIALGVVLSLAVPNRGRILYYDPSLPWQYVAGYVMFVANWVYAVLGTTHSICAPLWTVSIEEQFYLVWPALMKMLKRRAIITAGIVTFVLATITQFGLVMAGASAGYIYYGSVSRCDSLALGILLALFSDRLPKITRRTRILLVSGGLVAWVASSARLSDFVGPATLGALLDRMIIALASGAILYGCLFSDSKLLTGEGVVRLGKVSYGLYMLHYTALLLVLSLIHPRWGWQLLATKALGFAVTLVLSFASYRWIEAPFLRLKSRFAPVLSRPV
jgi:peptidoglycan/LPS O-acetylase OafA/YrhL